MNEERPPAPDQPPREEKMHWEIVLFLSAVTLSILAGLFLPKALGMPESRLSEIVMLVDLPVFLFIAWRLR